MTVLKVYHDFREQIINGNLKIYKPELIHVLYKKYIVLIRSFVNYLAKKVEQNPENSLVETLRYDQVFHEVLQYKYDFMSEENPIYWRELSYLE